jgi:hypothetical protein
MDGNCDMKRRLATTAKVVSRVVWLRRMVSPLAKHTLRSAPHSSKTAYEGDGALFIQPLVEMAKTLRNMAPMTVY